MAGDAQKFAMHLKNLNGSKEAVFRKDTLRRTRRIDGRWKAVRMSRHGIGIPTFRHGHTRVYISKFPKINAIISTHRQSQ